MICFNPVNAALKTNNEPKVEITGFSIFDSAVFVDPFLAKDKAVQLRYNQNFLTIEFGVLNFSNIQHTGYYYQLSKIDNDLIYAGSKQFASYTGLPPGEYTFRVKAENGGSATGETSLTIVISPPFWRTWWANLLSGTAVALLIWKFVKWRLRSIKIVETEKLKVQQLRTGQYRINWRWSGSLITFLPL